MTGLFRAAGSPPGTCPPALSSAQALQKSGSNPAVRPAQLGGGSLSRDPPGRASPVADPRRFCSLLSQLPVTPIRHPFPTAPVGVNSRGLD